MPKIQITHRTIPADQWLHEVTTMATEQYLDQLVERYGSDEIGNWSTVESLYHLRYRSVLRDRWNALPDDRRPDWAKTWSSNPIASLVKERKLDYLQNLVDRVFTTPPQNVRD